MSIARVGRSTVGAAWEDRDAPHVPDPERLVWICCAVQLPNRCYSRLRQTADEECAAVIAQIQTECALEKQGWDIPSADRVPDDELHQLARGRLTQSVQRNNHKRT